MISASLRGVLQPLPDGLASRIKCPNGKVAVMVADQAKEENGLYLADNELELPDIGRVFGVGDDIEDIAIGDAILCAPAAGKYIEWFLDEVPLACFLGDESDNGVSVTVPYDYHCLALVGEEGDMTLTPIGRNMLIARSGYAETFGDLHLPEGVGNRDGSAKVLAIGNGCEERKVGERVVYRAGAIVPLDLDPKWAEAYGVPHGCLAFCPESAVMTVIDG